MFACTCTGNCVHIHLPIIFLSYLEQSIYKSSIHYAELRFDFFNEFLTSSVTNVKFLVKMKNKLGRNFFETVKTVETV